MLRFTWSRDDHPSYALTHDEAIAQIHDWATRDFIDAPTGSLIVEELDADGQPMWRGYFKQVRELVSLLHQLRAEAEIRRRAQTPSRTPGDGHV